MTLPLRWVIAYATGLLLAAVGCASESATGGPGVTRPALSTPRARAFGDINRVNVVADEVLLAGPVGDSLSYYYEQAYPLMPQPEATYDLTYFTPEQLAEKPARREMRTYLVLADLNDESSPTTQMALRDLGEEKFLAAREDYRRGTSIVTDRWATDQTLIYLLGEGPDELGRLVARSYPSASARIAAADRAKLEANTYQSGRATVVRDSIRALTGVTIDIPTDYRVAKAEENLVWLRRDLRDIVQNVIVSSVPYTGEAQLSADNAVALRNDLGRRAVRSNTPGSYMTTNDRDLPVLTEVTELNGAYALEARGVWEMTDDFMGGPFFTYLIPDSASGRLYVVDAFAFAPSRGKRNYMQQLELIARSARVGAGTPAG